MFYFKKINPKPKAVDRNKAELTIFKYETDPLNRERVFFERFNKIIRTHIKHKGKTKAML